MKKITSFLSLALVISLVAFNVKKDDTYTVEPAKSSIEWLSKKVTGQHSGTVALASGSLVVSGNAIKSGSFTMDMTSIKPTDGAGDNLTKHLKSDDFFGTEKFPTSTFTITKVTAAGADQINIEGDLTIKGITKPISFPATVKKDGSYIAALAKIKVDRTKYDIKYNSKSIFASIGDKAIDDEFELTVKLQAKK